MVISAMDGHRCPRQNGHSEVDVHHQRTCVLEAHLRLTCLAFGCLRFSGDCARMTAVSDGLLIALDCSVGISASAGASLILAAQS